MPLRFGTDGEHVSEHRRRRPTMLEEVPLSKLSKRSREKRLLRAPKVLHS